MNEQRLKITLTSILFLCILVPVASATLITAEGGTIPILGGTEEFSITADSLPDGLSGFVITVSLSDPAKAEIVGVITPDWAGNPPFAVIGSVPSDSVDITIIDLYGNASQSLANFELVALNIRGDNAGTTGLNVTIDDIQDKDGFSIAASPQNGTIIVGSTPPPPATGTLNVTSSPTAANVLLDGVFKGITPIVIPNVTTGIHTVRVEKAGYSPLENLVTVNTGMTTSVHAVLSEIPPVPVNGTLNVQTNPPGANVFLDGVNRGITPLTILNIPAGIHTLRFEKSGYLDWENPVTIVAGETTNVTTVLTPVPPVPVNGTLNVQTTPTGAEMFLDGSYRGLTPLTLLDVSAGIHTLRLEKTGYLPFENPVTIVAGGVTNVTVTLSAIPPAPVNGTLDVQSIPSTALVLLDGSYRGLTPLTIPNIPSGIHTLRLEKTGYDAWETPVTILAGQTTNVTATLTSTPPVNGSVNVQSTPEGGNVYLDGVLRGITPVLIPGIAPGPHLVRIEKGGFEPWEEVVGVSAGITTEVNATLVAIPPPPSSGSVSVQSTPEDANVYLDGVMAGITPVLIPGVTPGSHTVRIEKTGYGPWESNVSVSAGATTLVSATLFPIPPPPTGSVNVQTEPAGANVFLDGVMAGISPVLIQGVSPGMHSIRIEKTGFIPWENTVSVSAGATVVVSVVLEPVPPPPETGSIDVETDPSGANTYLDGVFKGTTPLSIINVTPGTHAVKLNKTGYEPWEETVSVTAGETTLINETLSPVITPVPTTPAGYGTLVITSSPTGARILIDGIDRGETNGIISKVAAGTRNVTLEKPGYKSKSFSVSLGAGKYIALPLIRLEADTTPTTVPTTVPTTQPTTGPTTTVPTTVPTSIIPIPPGPSTGSLFVYSTPYGCSVYVDDAFRGTSPGIFGSIPPGTHVVRLTLAGYSDDVRSVQIKAGKMTTVTAVLIPDIGSLLSIVQ